MRDWISRRPTGRRGTRPLGRRDTMQLLAGQVLLSAVLPPVELSRAPPADAARPLDKLDLLVAGPSGEFLDQWGTELAPYLAHGLNLAKPVQREAVGGADGLTGANRFEAKPMDGSAALLLPGAALRAWLYGDPKVQFDVSAWVPMLAATAPCLVVGRPDFTGLPMGRRVRAAASRPGGAELPMLLALDQLRVGVQPVYGLESEADVARAYADRSVDVVFLHGARVPQNLARLEGAQPLMTLTGALDMPSLFPSTPRYEQLRAVRQPPAEDLSRALQAVVLTGALDMTLMLPLLVPPAATAQWRQAALAAANSPPLRAWAAELTEQLAAGADAAALLKPVQIDTETQTKLRKWIATRFPWKTG